MLREELLMGTLNIKHFTDNYLLYKGTFFHIDIVYNYINITEVVTYKLQPQQRVSRSKLRLYLVSQKGPLEY